MGAETTAFAGIGDEEVMPAVITGGLGKTVGKYAASKVFAKRLADKGLGRVVVALPVELSCTCQLMPSLKTFGNGYGRTTYTPGGAGCKAWALGWQERILCKYVVFCDS